MFDVGSLFHGDKNYTIMVSQELFERIMFKIRALSNTLELVWLFSLQVHLFN